MLALSIPLECQGSICETTPGELTSLKASEIIFFYPHNKQKGSINISSPGKLIINVTFFYQKKIPALAAVDQWIEH